MIRSNKFLYYSHNILRQLVPRFCYEKKLQTKLAGSAASFDEAEVSDRVNYYNKMDAFTTPGPNALVLKDLEVFKKPKTYRFDAYEYTRFFSGHLKADFFFGDVVTVQSLPTFQKSRPLNEENANAVLLNLNKVRHFVFVKDRKPFARKKNMLIGRSNVYQDNRIRFMQLYFDHPLCDLGQVNKGGHEAWIKPKLSISNHLDYKFILSLEGNDVATNLKWIMSSQSIAVMPRPKHETWFMEGRLIPDYHYILIKDDFSDLEAKLHYYIGHEAAAQQIVLNANRHVQQFLNKRREDYITFRVLQKYFYYTGQLPKLY